MRMIHARTKIDSCPAELWLNDIPIKGLTPKLAHNISVPAHLYLLDGANTLGDRGKPWTYAIDWAATTAGCWTGEAPQLPASRPIKPGSSRVTRQRQFFLENLLERLRSRAGGFSTNPAQTANDLGSDVRSPWHWERADSLQLDSATISGAAAVLETLRDSLAAGDPDVLLRLGYRRFKNASDAYPERPFSILVDQFRRAVARNAALPEWGFPPLDPNDFDFRVVGRGRLLECINRD